MQIPDSKPESLQAYAKHRGVSREAVSKAIRTNRLRECVVVSAKGQPKISDFALADQEWEANTDTTRQPLDEDSSKSAQRLKAAQADLAELKFKEKARQLLLASDVEHEWADILSRVRTKLMSIPSVAKQRIPELSIAGVGALEDSIREVLEELSND